MVLNWIVRIVLVIVISGITIGGYGSGLRGPWLIGYVALCTAVVYGVIALVVAIGAIWIVVVAIGLTLAVVL